MVTDDGSGEQPAVPPQEGAEEMEEEETVESMLAHEFEFGAQRVQFGDLGSNHVV